MRDSKNLVAPVAHIDDRDSVTKLIEALEAIHGPEYQFAVKPWDGETDLDAPDGKMAYRFIAHVLESAVALAPGDLVRGCPITSSYERRKGELGEVVEPTAAEVWPGDVLTLRSGERVTITGRGVYLEVVVDETGYPAPKLAMLRHLTNRPGGCASYEGAFRREALPPSRTGSDDDQRGVNRVNEHTLDMRPDRMPLPRAHHHGPVPSGNGRMVNHSETAIVLPRSVYGLPEVDDDPNGHVVLYRRPGEDPSDTYTVSVRPGSIVVTPATEQGVMGHRFENAFAMLVAIPGFVSPSNYIPA